MREIKTGYEVGIEQHWHKINIKIQFNELNIYSKFDKKVYWQKTVRTYKISLSEKTPKRTPYFGNQRSEGFYSRSFYSFR